MTHQKWCIVQQIELQPGETKTVTFVLEEKIYVESTVRVPVKYTLDSCVLDLQEDPVAYEIAKPYLKLGFFEEQNNEGNDDSATAEAMSKDMMEAMVRYMPL